MTSSRLPGGVLMLFVAAICLSAGLPAAFAMPANPISVNVQQPDGTRITLRVHGDEFSHWYEDLDGYAVVAQRGQYVYASLGDDGSLEPTAHVVGHVDPAAAGLIPGLQPTPAARALQRELAFSAPVTAAGPEVLVPPTGAVQNLVVLCKFSDHSFGVHTRPEADYDMLFNAVGGDPTLAPTGSVRDCYTENSYGTMTLSTTVAAWVTLPNTEAYYADGSNSNGTYPTNPQGMVEDALNAVDAIVDFGSFDTDNDGYVDAIDIIHSGYGAETGGGGGNWIWSHRWSLWALPGGQWTSGDTNALGEYVKVYDYHTEPALWGTSGTDIVRIGVIAHETGHFFGLPDLYDTNGNGEGIGSYGMMANSWGFDFTQYHPPHFSAWSKIFLGWVTPTMIVASGVYSAPEVELMPTVFRIDQNYPAGEYLLIENRQPIGLENVMPQGGLAIWHIDEAKPDNTEEGYPGQPGWPGNDNHYKVALLQADGNYDLEHDINRGDGGDVYHAGGVSAIDEMTVPNTDAYQGGNIYVTHNAINGISAAGASMTFTYDSFFDCNGNGIDDALDISGGTSSDCNGDGVPDECQLGTNDCNGNSVPDDCDITNGTSTDCNGNGVPDLCETALNGVLLDEVFESGLPAGWSATGIFQVTVQCPGVAPCSGSRWAYAGDAVNCTYGDDEIGELVAPSIVLGYGANELTFCSRIDTEAGYDFGKVLVNGVAVWQDSGGSGTWQDEVVDLGDFAGQEVTITFQFASDAYVNGPLGWQVDNVHVETGTPDCNGNGVPDACDIASGASADCNNNGLPDECELSGGAGVDCDANGVIDACEIAGGAPDCNGNGMVDSCDIAGKLFWSHWVDHRIVRANLDGTHVEVLLSAATWDLVVDRNGGKVYWSDPDANAIQRANLDGSSAETIVAGEDAYGLALDPDAGKLYWTGSFGIRRANLDGTEVETVVTGVGDLRGVAIDRDAGKLYWANRTTAALQRANLDGTGIETLFSTAPEPRSPALDMANGKIYWSELAPPYIKRANLDGSSLEILVQGGGGPRDVTLDLTNGKMYWGTAATGSPGGVWQADLDGSNPVQLASGFPSFIALAEPAGDCDANTIPDTCEPDCNANGIADGCDPDCDGDGQPDECELAAGARDCNSNAIPDDCDIANGTSDDCDSTGVPDECEPSTKLTASDAAGGDAFAYSVSVSGDTALVGAYADADAGADSGAAYVYRFNGTRWLQKQKLTASDAAGSSRFGWSVSVSGDTAIIGASVDDVLGSASGSAYVFRFDGTDWVEEQKLIPSDAGSTDFFGWSVSISGNVAVVGAYGNNDAGADSGSAYVFRFDGTSWIEEQKLTASDAAASDKFGGSVSVSGNIAIVGARDDDGAGTDSGSAYVFRFDGASWIEEQKLTASDAAAIDRFGCSVSVSEDTVFVGAESNDANGPDSGSAYVYRFDGASWVQTQKLTASDAAAYDWFGCSVSVSGETAVVGAFRDNNTSVDTGSAYVFRFDGTSWRQTRKVTASDAAMDDFFGRSVSSGGDTVVVGAYGDDDAGPLTGAAYVFEYAAVGTCLDDDCDGFSGDAGCTNGLPWDCDDGDPNISPGIAETTCNGVDDDCDATTLDDPDNDTDGVGLCTDCDDGNPDIYPGNTETACNGIDDDCDPGTTDAPGGGTDDCNVNGMADECDIILGTSSDCNVNGMPDECELTDNDCNANGVPDECDVSGNTLPAGHVLDFDGVAAHVLVPSTPELRPANNFTIEAWVNISSVGTAQSIFRHDDNGGGDDGYYVIVMDTGVVRFGATNANGGVAQSVYSAQTLSAGQWYHVAGVYDNSVLKVYIDGQETSKPAAGDVFYAVLDNVNIGRRGGTGSPDTAFLDGMLDEVRFWNVPRSQAEIQATMNVPLAGTEPGLVGYWKFDEGSGPTAGDSANGHDGTLVNDPAWGAVGTGGASADCNANGTPDECELAGNDCNANTVPDDCELDGNDCNSNGVPDDCDATGGGSADCNANGTPDECELAGNDCNANTVPDDCELAGNDCNSNMIPDECDPDADGDLVPDDCDICPGFDDSVDTDGDLVPDGCDPCPADNPDDPDGDGVCTSDDNCELANPDQLDCQPNGVGDVCDIAHGTSSDGNGNGVPDECEVARPMPDDAFDISGTTFGCTTDAECLAGLNENSQVDCILPPTGDPGDGTCYVRKNRYISADPNPANDGTLTARRVSLVLDPDNTVVLGWVGEPVETTVVGGEATPQLLARIVDEPNRHYRDWSVDDGGQPWVDATVHVGDCEISPGRAYLVQAIVQGADIQDAANYSEPLVLSTVSDFGDVVGASPGLPPDAIRNFKDISAVVRGFQSVQTEPKVWLDLQGGTATPEVPDFTDINFNDINHAVAGFQGGGYPFDDPCACVGQPPCPR